MILKITLLFATILLFAYHQADHNKCERYRNGKFYFHPTNGNKVFHYTIERNDSLQVETDKDNGNSSTWKIHWKDDCSYEMRFVKGTEKLTKEALDMKQQLILQTTILSGTSSWYIFESRNNLVNLVIKDTIWLKP